MPSKDINNPIFKLTINEDTVYTLGACKLRNRDFTPGLEACLIENVTTDVGDGIVQKTRRTTTNITSDGVMPPNVKW